MPAIAGDGVEADAPLVPNAKVEVEEVQVWRATDRQSLVFFRPTRASLLLDWNGAGEKVTAVLPGRATRPPIPATIPSPRPLGFYAFS
ncbi:MAG TPA: hypothetical protein VN445_00795 [Rectinemataceae bacterium]|nr:hypothetical protein [Rectinemataceae bacterium]